MRILIAFLMTVLWCGPAAADPFNFEDTAEGMVEKLAAEPKKTGTSAIGHKLKFRGAVRFRGVKVIRRDEERTIEEPIQVPARRTGNFVNLAVLFDFDSYALRNESFPLLDELAKALADPRLAGKSVNINGHTDADGPDDYNLRLSFNRAISVREYLSANHGLPSERLKVVGYGEAMPLKPNTTDTNKQLNRRVEVVPVE